MARTKSIDGKPAYRSMEARRIEGVVLTLTLDTRGREDSLPVAVRVNHNRRTIYYRTGLKCTIKEWEKLVDATGRGAKKGELFTVKSEQINVFNKVIKAVNELLSSNTFTLENLKAKLTGRTNGDFSELWESIIAKKRNEEKVGTADSYSNAYNSFTKHIGKHVSFDRISPHLVNHWANKKKSEGLSTTTISIYQRSMRVVCNEALRLGLIKMIQYPFGGGNDKVSIRKGRSRKDDFLDVQTILKLTSFVAPESWQKGYADLVNEAIAMFMFSYLGNGLNTADIAYLEYNDHYFESGEKELKFIRKKTEDTSSEEIEIKIPIIPELREIMDKYATKPERGCRLFPQILGDIEEPEQVKKTIKQTNANYGDRLKKAAKEVGIVQSISMTFARHSFATNLIRKNVTERYISQAMGHSNKNITGNYIGDFSTEDRYRYNSLLLNPHKNI